MNTTTKNMTTRDDIIWLAGIIDGEGCVFFSNRRDYAYRASGANRTGLSRKSIRCDLRICMAHHQTIDRVAAHLREIVGDSSKVNLKLESRAKDRVRPLKNVCVHNREAIRQVLRAVMPFLFTKKMEAQLALMFLDRAHGHTRYRTTDYDVMLAGFATDLRNGRGEARAQEFLRQVIPSQAAAGQSDTTVATEGVETRNVSPNNNRSHECPAPDRQLRLVEGEEIVRSSDESRSAV